MNVFCLFQRVNLDKDFSQHIIYKINVFCLFQRVSLVKDVTHFYLELNELSALLQPLKMEQIGMSGRSTLPPNPLPGY